MKKLLTTLAVLTVVATPAFAAQSYRGDAANAYASDNSGVPSTTQTNEEARFDHAKGYVADE